MSAVDGAVRPLLLGCLVLFVGGVVADVGLVVVRIVMGFSGFDITTIVPTCTLPLYQRLKFTYVYLPLRTATAAAALAGVLGVVGAVMAGRARSKLTQEGGEGQSQSVELIIPSRGLFVVASFHCLFVLTNAAHCLTVLVDNQTCPIVDSTKWTILLAIALLAQLMAVVLVILVMVLHSKMPNREEKNEEENGRKSERKGQGGAKKEEEELSRAFQMQAKEYISGSYKQKGDMMQGLMMNGEEIYQPDNRNDNRNGNRNDKHYDYTSQSDEDAQQDRNSQNKQRNSEAPTSRQPPYAGEQGRSGQMGQQYNREGEAADDSQQDGQEQNSRGPMNSPTGGSGKKANKTASRMHAYHLINNEAADDGPGYVVAGAAENGGHNGGHSGGHNGGHSGGHGGGHNGRMPMDMKSQQEKRQKDLLDIQDDGDLSEKFDERQFQLQGQLNRAIKKDKDEDLSPLELKELMQFTQKQYKLTHNDEHALKLERDYKVSEKGKEIDYHINIHFKKIKDYKLNQSKAPEEEIHQEQAEQEEAKVTEPLEKPIEIGEDLIKILKVTLFKHSDFLQKNAPPEQEECPISRYVEKDERLEILQPDDKFKGGKNKKVEYSKEQLIYSKKKKDNSQEDKQKGSVRQEFNEGEYIKEERLQIFGEEWVRERRKEELLQESTQNRHKKRKLVETIRSKYNH